jgi:hypothetical protein
MVDGDNFQARTLKKILCGHQTLRNARGFTLDERVAAIVCHMAKFT